MVQNTRPRYAVRVRGTAVRGTRPSERQKKAELNKMEEEKKQEAAQPTVEPEPQPQQKQHQSEPESDGIKFGSDAATTPQSTIESGVMASA
eukprot:COSAG02_NODE_2430_length_8883_cov_3.641621_5_plen_91_part_00